MTLEEYHAALKAQGVPKLHLAMKCPVCQTVQSPADLIAAGAGKDMDEVEKYVGFSCVGRFTGSGPHKKDEAPGRGCNWTLGGFFSIHKLEVVTPDGKKHMRFELATPEEARAHMESTEPVEAK